MVCAIFLIAAAKIVTVNPNGPHTDDANRLAPGCHRSAIRSWGGRRMVTGGCAPGLAKDAASRALAVSADRRCGARRFAGWLLLIH
jgi:hypothetical protein